MDDKTRSEKLNDAIRFSRESIMVLDIEEQRQKAAEINDGITEFVKFYWDIFQEKGLQAAYDYHNEWIYKILEEGRTNE